MIQPQQKAYKGPMDKHETILKYLFEIKLEWNVPWTVLFKCFLCMNQTSNIMIWDPI
jgi:hypothetical protein